MNEGKPARKTRAFFAGDGKAQYLKGENSSAAPILYLDLVVIHQ